MAKPKPVPTPLGNTAQNKPIAGRPAPKKRWTFSFRFWKQIEYFGLSESKPSWFVSVLERLQELSRHEVDEFRASVQTKVHWRYHGITWTQQNIPIQRSELTWLDADYRDNDVEYPLFQFTVSAALGRVVGFWDEQEVFNVVLFDPLHNIQPSKRFDYRVDKCFPLSCRYTALLGEFDRLKRIECHGTDCPAHIALRAGPSDDHAYNVVILRLDDSMLKEAKDAIERGDAASFESLLEDGILYAMENGSPKSDSAEQHA